MDNLTPHYKFFALHKISMELEIKKDKLYNNFKGRYDSLDGDAKRVAEFMMPKVKEFFERLGYAASFKKLPKVK